LILTKTQKNYKPTETLAEKNRLTHHYLCQPKRPLERMNNIIVIIYPNQNAC
jgi:hypothetical protein